MDRRLKTMYVWILTKRFQAEKNRLSYAISMVLSPNKRPAGFRKYFLEFFNKYKKN